MLHTKAFPLISRIQRLRAFSTASLSRFDWNHGSKSWDYTYSVISPREDMPTKATLVLFPSCSLLSTKEEWREFAEYLSELGFKSVLLDWPGWHNRNEPMNWALEDDVESKTLISTFTEFAYSSLKHISESAPSSSLHVCAAGGASAVHLKRAISELNKESIRFDSFTCFSPSWRFYLTRSVSEGFPRKLARRRSIADWFLSSFFVRSKMMYRLYRSKFGLAKMTKRLYVDKIQHNPDRLSLKKQVIMRERPLSIDAAMIAGHFDPVSSTPEFINELVGFDPAAEPDQHHDDSDDDDSLLNIKVPNWVKSETSEPSAASTSTNTDTSTMKIHLVFPQDVSGADKTELRTVRQWAEKSDNVVISEIPGKLFCHEENPALSATIMQEFLASR